jgi:peptidoglycan/LPS O-acetylase OafA/YrhL
MKREVSLYLDLLRFLAAGTVFLQHFSWMHFSGGLFYQIEPYGSQAVIVFFVLSGYLIGHVTDRPGVSGRGYALDRAARVYSVVLPALVLTFALDALGRALCPDLFVDGWYNGSEPLAAQFFQSAFFVNQIWFVQMHPGTNVPYWSMGYEVWYYVIFGCMIFLPRRWAVVSTLALLAMVGPRIAALFPVWLAGLAAQRLSRRVGQTRRATGWLLFGGSFLAWASFEIAAHLLGLRVYVPDIPHQSRELWQDLLIGVFVAVHLFGMNSVAPALGPVLEPFARPIRWLAGRSFALYLLQMPFLQFMLVLSPFPVDSWPGRALVVVGTLVLVALVAEVTERRKDVWRQWFGGVAAWVVPVRTV